MKILDPSTTKYLIAAGISEEEIREFVEAEHQCSVDETGEGFDVETEIKKLMDRKAIYDKDHNITFRLRGKNGDVKKAWINDAEVFVDKSMELRKHANEFNWGYGGSGPAQFALAVCIELFGPDKAQELYQDFKFRIIAGLQEKDFDVTINIKTEGNTIKSVQVVQGVH